MNAAKCTATDYVGFLVTTKHSYSCPEAEKVQPEREGMLAHDAFTLLLQRLEPSAEALWVEVQTQVNKASSVLVIDDTTLDKPYASKIELVTRHWSGKHHEVVQGINLVSLPWMDGERHIPFDYGVYDKVQTGTARRSSSWLLQTAILNTGPRMTCAWVSCAAFSLVESAWATEFYHRGIKQFCGIEKSQACFSLAQRNYIGLVLRAFLRIERHAFITGILSFASKLSIVRHAVRAYLASPLYSLSNLTT